MTDQKQLELGISKDLLVLENYPDLTAAIADMISQARMKVCIFSYELEPKIFHRDSICQAVNQLIAFNSRARVQILVQDIDPLIKVDHCLVGLMRHLSSFVEIRKTAVQHSNNDHAFVTVDDCGYYHQHPRNSRQYEVCYNDRQRVRLLQQDFLKMWERSLRATELLRLYI